LERLLAGQVASADAAAAAPIMPPSPSSWASPIRPVSRAESVRASTAQLVQDTTDCFLEVAEKHLDFAEEQRKKQQPPQKKKISANRHVYFLRAKKGQTLQAHCDRPSYNSLLVSFLAFLPLTATERGILPLLRAVCTAACTRASRSPRVMETIICVEDIFFRVLEQVLLVE
jgi:hypothetical protein